MENFNNKDIAESEPACSNNVIIVTENGEDFANNYYETLIPPVEDNVIVDNYDIPIELLQDQNVLDNLQNEASNNNNFMHGECTIIKLPMNHNIIPQNNCFSDHSDMRLLQNHQQYLPRPRTLPFINLQSRKRKIDYNNSPYLRGVNVIEMNKSVNAPEPSPSVPPTAASRQLEVLTAAKSLFSKRTRTLFHWMYPAAPTAAIKATVANSWNHLGKQEKEFYISQVLGRFGFPQSRLMVNPQLSSIRTVPAPPSELQVAISSITDSPITFPQEGANYMKRKRRQGRPRSDKKTAKIDAETGLGFPFQDDPELSQELNQFALTHNLSNNPIIRF